MTENVSKGHVTTDDGDTRLLSPIETLDFGGFPKSEQPEGSLGLIGTGKGGQTLGISHPPPLEPRIGSERLSSSTTDSGEISQTPVEVREKKRRLVEATADEYEPMLERERKALLTLKFERGLTERQVKHLQFIRWSLDQIEDARHGRALDEWEWLVEQQEKIGHDIDGYLKKIADAGHSLQRRSPKRKPTKRKKI